MNNYCNLPESVTGVEGFGGLRQWPRGRTLKWHVATPVPGFNVSDCQDVYKGAWDQWSNNSGLSHDLASNARTANIVIGVRSIDRSGGVLAEAQLPWAGIAADAQLQVWFDLNDKWTTAKNWQGTGRFPLPVVATHEFGHSLGLGHEQNGKKDAIMDPSVSDITTLQPWDIQQIQARYGIPSQNPDPGDDNDTGSGDDLERTLRLLTECLRKLSKEEREFIEKLVASK